MLVISRRVGELIYVFDKETRDTIAIIKITEIHGDKVRVGLKASMNIGFLRDNAKSKI